MPDTRLLFEHHILLSSPDIFHRILNNLTTKYFYSTIGWAHVRYFTIRLTEAFCAQVTVILITIYHDHHQYRSQLSMVTALHALPYNVTAKAKM